MLETSKDVLYFTIALAIIILTFFMAWVLFYVVMILKKSNEFVNELKQVINSFKEKLERVGALFNTLEEKIKHSASYLPLLFQGITELVNYFKKRKVKKEKQKK